VARKGTAQLEAALPTSPSYPYEAKQENTMAKVIIGVDPHKLSATIEVVDSHEKFLGSGRFATDQAGYTAMRNYAKTWSERIWAVEGSNGAGRPLAQRLLESGEDVQLTLQMQGILRVPSWRCASMGVSACLSWQSSEV